MPNPDASFPDMTHMTIARQDRRARMAKGLSISPAFMAERDDKIVRDFQRGIDRRELSYDYDLSFNRITQILNDAGCGLKPRKHPEKASASTDPISGNDAALRREAERADKAFLKALFRAHISADTLPPNMGARDFIDRCHGLGMTVPLRACAHAEAVPA